MKREEIIALGYLEFFKLPSGYRVQRQNKTSYFGSVDIISMFELNNLALKMKKKKLKCFTLSQPFLHGITLSLCAHSGNC